MKAIQRLASHAVDIATVRKGELAPRWPASGRPVVGHSRLAGIVLGSAAGHRCCEAQPFLRRRSPRKQPRWRAIGGGMRVAPEVAFKEVLELGVRRLFSRSIISKRATCSKGNSCSVAS